MLSKILKLAPKKIETSFNMKDYNLSSSTRIHILIIHHVITHHVLIIHHILIAHHIIIRIVIRHASIHIAH